MRDDHVAAMTLTKHIPGLRECGRYLFSGGIAAIHRSMYACWMAFIDPRTSTWTLSALVMVIIGGAGSVAGPMVKKM